MINNNFFTQYLERLENLHLGISTAVQNLPPEAMDWVPGPEMNSPAVLLAHTAGSLRYWIGDVALDDPSGRDREREFQTRGLAGADLLQRLENVLAYARAALPQLHLEDLEKVSHTVRDGKEVTRGWALLHALEHASLHLGHIELTCQLWKEKSTTSHSK